MIKNKPDAVDELVVHLLEHGRPLCNFSDKVPRDWPPGHRWVAREHLEEITCPRCMVASCAT